MPLNTVIERDERALELRWGGFHVAAMVCAVSWDTGAGIFVDNTEPEMETVTKEDGTEVTAHVISPKNVFEFVDYSRLGATKLGHSPVVLQKDYTFFDMMDGEVFELKAGDKLYAFRS
jgi:hypothetical protein